MRKSHLIALVLAVAMMGYTGFAQAQNIAGSLHDLTVGETVTTDRICVYCHTPHNTAAAGTANAPLWNRNNAAVTYQMYASTTLDGVIQGTPEGVSLACLSCHDGTTDYSNVIVNATPTVKAGVMGAPLALGTGGAVDLRNDHPISIAYNDADDTGLRGPTTLGSKVTVNNTANLPLYAGTGGSQVECASCHNPHDNTTNVKFLRDSTAASALCINCHLK